MGTLVQDVRFGARTLIETPGATDVAALARGTKVDPIIAFRGE